MIRTRDFTEWLPLISRDDFWSRVAKEPGDGCWHWTGSISDEGYGKFSVPLGNRRYRNLLAHRVALALGGIPLTQGKVTDHKCRNRRCVRPSHLRVVTQWENLMAQGSLSITNLNRLRQNCLHGHGPLVWVADSAQPRGGQRRCMVCKLEREAQRRAAKKN